MPHSYCLSQWREKIVDFERTEKVSLRLPRACMAEKWSTALEKWKRGGNFCFQFSLQFYAFLAWYKRGGKLRPSRPLRQAVFIPTCATRLHSTHRHRSTRTCSEIIAVRRVGCNCVALLMLVCAILV